MNGLGGLRQRMGARVAQVTSEEFGSAHGFSIGFVNV